MSKNTKTVIILTVDEAKSIVSDLQRAIDEAIDHQMTMGMAIMPQDSNELTVIHVNPNLTRD